MGRRDECNKQIVRQRRTKRDELNETNQCSIVVVSQLDEKVVPVRQKSEAENATAIQADLEAKGKINKQQFKLKLL